MLSLLLALLVTGVRASVYIPAIMANQYRAGDYIAVDAMSSRSTETTSFPYDPEDLGILCSRPSLRGTGASGGGAYPYSNPIGKVLAGEVVRNSGVVLRFMDPHPIIGKCILDEDVNDVSILHMQKAVLYDYTARYAIDDGHRAVSKDRYSDDLIIGHPLGANVAHDGESTIRFRYYRDLNATIYINEVEKGVYNIVGFHLTPTRLSVYPGPIRITSVTWKRSDITWAHREDVFKSTGTSDPTRSIIIAALSLVAFSIVSFFFSTGAIRGLLMHARSTGKADKQRFLKWRRNFEVPSDAEGDERTAMRETHDAKTREPVGGSGVEDFASTAYDADEMSDSESDGTSALRGPEAPRSRAPVTIRPERRERCLHALDIIFCCCIRFKLMERATDPIGHMVDSETLPPLTGINTHPQRQDAENAVMLKEVVMGSDDVSDDDSDVHPNAIRTMTEAEALEIVHTAHEQDTRAGGRDSHRFGKGVVVVHEMDENGKKKHPIAISLGGDDAHGTHSAIGQRSSAMDTPGRAASTLTRVEGAVDTLKILRKKNNMDATTGQRLHPVAKGRWIALRLDVWRPSKNGFILYILYGTGIQVFVSTILTFLFSIGSGYLLDTRATIIGVFFISWLCTAPIATYAGMRLSSLYYYAAPPHRREHKNVTGAKMFAMGYIIPSFVMWVCFVLAQIISAAANSSAAISATMWGLFIGMVVLSGMIGALAGTLLGCVGILTTPKRRLALRPIAPTRWASDHIPRHVPPASRSYMQCSWAGALSIINNVCVSGFFLIFMDGMWRGYHVGVGIAIFFGFAMWLFNTAVLGIIRTYTTLRGENWKWQWRTWIMTFYDVAGMLVITAAIYYFFFAPRTVISDPSSIILYFVVMGAFVVYIAAMHASIALWASIPFVLYIFRSSKAD